MRYLALDQATHNTGWSIFEDKKLISSGVFKATGNTTIERIYSIAVWFQNLIDKERFDKIAIEGIQGQESSNGKPINNILTLATLAKLSGVLEVIAFQHKIPLDIVSSATWRSKIGVTGANREEKKNAMLKIAKLYTSNAITDDEADAIGIGIYLSK